MNTEPRKKNPERYYTRLSNIPTPWPMKTSETLAYVLIHCALLAIGIWLGAQIAGLMPPGGLRAIPFLLCVFVPMCAYEIYCRAHQPADLTQRRQLADQQAAKDADK